MKSYSEKMRDPRWQKKRLEILQRDGFKCIECTDDKSTLHVHHTRYIKGREPWDYAGGFLVTLCETCHEQLHQNESSVIEHIAGTFYGRGATWSVLWGLAYTLDFAVEPDCKFSPDEWESIFRHLETGMKAVADGRTDG